MTSEYDSECEVCGHRLELHGDKYGCQYEQGDAWVEGTNFGGWVARGPCGCKLHEVNLDWRKQWTLAKR